MSIKGIIDGRLNGRAVSLLLVLAWSVPLMAQKSYWGGGINTVDSVKYGKIEARIKSSPVVGTVTGFFFFSLAGNASANAPWRELDFEFLGRYKDRYQLNIWDGTQGNRIQATSWDNFGDPSAGYHTYAIEWTPTAIKFIRDGQVVRNETELADKYDVRMAPFFNLWPGSGNVAGWSGTLDASKLPSCVFVSWYRYSEYVLSGGDNGANFKVKRYENFEDEIDTAYWHLNHNETFDGNGCDFMKSNVLTKDGAMVLALTHKDQGGYNGAVPADNQADPDPPVQAAPGRNAVAGPFFIPALTGGQCWNIQGRAVGVSGHSQGLTGQPRIVLMNHYGNGRLSISK